MLTLDAFFEILDKIAPLSLSHKLISRGDYDNSGILIKNHQEVKKVLFSLDISESVLKRAKTLGVDTIVTHHPAIYSPLKSLLIDDINTKTIFKAIKMGLNVISMHLNLDVCDGGIDACLTKALGGEKYKILFPLEEGLGYGREFYIDGITFNDFIKNAKKSLGTKRVVSYGNKNTVLKKGASFCGGGSSYAQKYLDGDNACADVIVTSDMPHHVIKNVVESGKCLLIVSHYSSENFGFNQYFNKIKTKTAKKVECFYYADKRLI